MADLGVRVRLWHPDCSSGWMIWLRRASAGVQILPVIGCFGRLIHPRAVVFCQSVADLGVRVGLWHPDCSSGWMIWLRRASAGVQILPVIGCFGRLIHPRAVVFCQSVADLGV